MMSKAKDRLRAKEEAVLDPLSTSGGSMRAILGASTASKLAWAARAVYTTPYRASNGVVQSVCLCPHHPFRPARTRSTQHQSSTSRRGITELNFDLAGHTGRFNPQKQGSHDADTGAINIYIYIYCIYAPGCSSDINIFWLNIVRLYVYSPK